MPILVFKKKEVDGPQSGCRLPPPISMLWLPTSASNRTDLALQRDGKCAANARWGKSEKKAFDLQWKYGGAEGI
jgi:hypothetical protein